MDVGAVENGVTDFVILYASQTGNAKAIAEDIAEQCEAKGLRPNLACVSENGKKFFIERTACVVFVGSTTGDGEPPDTARKFWRLVNKKGQPSDTFSHLSYTILGLGDTNYTNFCNFGKSIDQKLQSLGASRFYQCGWADDGTGLEIVVEPWIEGLFPALTNYLTKFKRCDGTRSELILSSNGICNNTKQLEMPVSDNDNKKSMNSEPCTEKTIIMENLENVSLSDLSRTEDFWKIVAKYDLDILSQEQLQGLSIKSCAFSSDTKLSLPLQPATYLAVRYLDDVKETATNFTFPLTSAASSIVEMKLVSLKPLTSQDAVKNALEVTLDATENTDKFEYLPGDSFGIVVKNPDVEVVLFLALLGVSDLADKTYELTINKDTKKKSASIPKCIPAMSSLRYVFEYCVDIRSVPKKPLIRTLIEYTSDPLEQRRLKELVSKEGSSEYNKYVRELNLTLLDLLIIFQSCKPPVTALLEHLPQLQPRSYSAISSPLRDRKKISFAFNVVEITPGETVTFARKGICTGWLASCADQNNTNNEHLDESMKNLTLENSKSDILVKIYLRSNQNFHLPSDSSTPIVMVGPGTGVAPFVGFLRHRQMIALSNNGTTFGESWLFFGCRHEKKDYLYREELEKFQKDGVLNHLIVSFSRDDESVQKAKYVQDNIRKCGADLVSLMVEKGAIVYVCGDAKHMAKDVFEAFVSILEVNNGLSMVEARKFIAQMQIDKRYLQDVWA